MQQVALWPPYVCNGMLASTFTDKDTKHANKSIRGRQGGGEEGGMFGWRLF